VLIHGTLLELDFRFLVIQVLVAVVTSVSVMNL